MDNVHEVSKGNGLAIAEWSKGAVGGWIQEGLLDIVDASKEQVMRGCGWHEELVWEPGDSVGNADSTCLPHPHTIAAVGFESRADIPAVFGMGRPAGSLSRFDVDEDTDARWGNGGTIEVKCSVEVCPGREFGVETGTAKEVKTQFSLGQKLVPQVEGEILVDAAESCDEVVFESANGPFGRVPSVHVGWGQLVVNIFVFHELFQDSGCFIVKALEEGSEASCT